MKTTLCSPRIKNLQSLIFLKYKQEIDHKFWKCLKETITFSKKKEKKQYHNQIQAFNYFKIQTIFLKGSAYIKTLIFPSWEPPLRTSEDHHQDTRFWIPVPIREQWRLPDRRRHHYPQDDEIHERVHVWIKWKCKRGNVSSCTPFPARESVCPLPPRAGLLVFECVRSHGGHSIPWLFFQAPLRPPLLPTAFTSFIVSSKLPSPTRGGGKEIRPAKCELVPWNGYKIYKRRKRIKGGRNVALNLYDYIIRM